MVIPVAFMRQRGAPWKMGAGRLAPDVDARRFSGGPVCGGPGEICPRTGFSPGVVFKLVEGPYILGCFVRPAGLSHGSGVKATCRVIESVLSRGDCLAIRARCWPFSASAACFAHCARICAFVYPSASGPRGHCWCLVPFSKAGPLGAVSDTSWQKRLLRIASA
eukprot:2574106-Pyramimonas_sp.AAC.2